MTTPAKTPLPFVDLLAEARPDVGEPLQAMFATLGSETAIPRKYKLLIALAVDASGRHPNGCTHIADMAREAGATEEELMDCLSIIGLLCGTGGLATASGVFPELRGKGFGGA